MQHTRISSPRHSLTMCEKLIYVTDFFVNPVSILLSHWASFQSRAQKILEKMMAWMGELFTHVVGVCNILPIRTVYALLPQNDECTALSDSSARGICMTTTECANGGGKSDGNCAAGFGVCCVHTLSDCPSGTVSKVGKKNHQMFLSLLILTVCPSELHLYPGMYA